MSSIDAAASTVYSLIVSPARVGSNCGSNILSATGCGATVASAATASTLTPRRGALLARGTEHSATQLVTAVDSHMASDSGSGASTIYRSDGEPLLALDRMSIESSSPRAASSATAQMLSIESSSPRAASSATTQMSSSGTSLDPMGIAMCDNCAQVLNHYYQDAGIIICKPCYDVHCYVKYSHENTSPGTSSTFGEVEGKDESTFANSVP